MPEMEPVDVQISDKGGDHVRKTLDAALTFRKCIEDAACSCETTS
jgi:hypothetical protein